MAPEKVPLPGSYDRTDLQSILRRASRLTGRTLRDFVDSGEMVIGGVNTKGVFGQLVESGYFLLDNNSSPLPDFREAGLELKVTPIKRIGSGLVSKERLILGIINYDDVPRRRFDIFLEKDSHILIVFYLWTEDSDVLDYRFLKVVDWEPTPEELRMIREDWDVIEGYVMRGEAHLLSERHTKYLAACTKGAGHGRDMRTQPFSSELAKQRALSFKASFMTDLFNTRPDINDVLPPDDDSEGISSGRWGEGQSFEEYVVGLYSPFVGKTCYEIEAALGLDLNPSSKQYYYTLSLAMAGVLRKRHIKEFVQAGIQFKTIRIKSNGKSKESMSFPYIRYDELAEQEWEGSDLFSQLDRQFFSPVFSFTLDDPSAQPRKDLVFRGAFFWTLSDEDMESVRGVWEDTRAKVLAGDFDHFVSMAEGRVAHVRPHARDSSDVAYFHGRPVRKMSFWLNGRYIEDVVRRNLG
ncbi:MAG: hypothetical protein IKR86_05960 [Candidatus Methanomethylophilaceae archaeon]|nr:hypothetical protein [Candidatus Methanomethylophilaceae archaeon]